MQKITERDWILLQEHIKKREDSIIFATLFVICYIN